MKAISGFNVLLIVAALTGLFLTSCDDKKPVNPKPKVNVKVEDVNGTYNGKMTITQGTTKNEPTVTFTANRNVITFADFPMTEIAQSLISDKTKAEAAVKALGKIKYELNYTPKLNNSKTGVELTYAPKALELQVPFDGANKKIVVTFSAKQKGVYNNKKLQSELTADKITVDGTAVTPFTAIKYSLPNFVRK